MKKIIAATLFVSACATTGRSLPTEPASRGIAPTFKGGMAASDEAHAWFPALASDAVLPSAARYNRELSTSRDRFALSVRICVAPDGGVKQVEVIEGSGETLLDNAAARDIAAWQFESFAAPAHVRVCKQLELGYEPKAEYSAIRIPLVRTSTR